MSLIPPNQVDQARKIPVAETAAKLGLSPKKEGKSTMWKDQNSQFAINVTGEKFFDHHADHGGAGSISLVQHVRNCNFREAVAWLTGLHHEIKAEQSHRPIFPKAEPATPPEPTFEEAAAKYAQRHEHVWPVARDYLTKQRRLPAGLIDAMHDAGKIFATDYQHIDRDKNPTFKRPAVAFVGESADGQHRSIFLRDTKHDSCWRMFVGKKTLAPFTIGNLSAAEKIVVVESPIDAISYYCLQTGRPEQPETWRTPHKLFIASMGGNSISQPLIDLAMATGKPLVCALDNDPAGNRGWLNLQIKTLFRFAEQRKQVVHVSDHGTRLEL
ncbi:MAG: toprim domain-containing protein, partial [Verrucomicrobiales bacterium]|nr:toprim domain-containing protein [Verrucomicrobiales bacterium]